MAYLKTRTPQHVFNMMALTVAEPGHPDAYHYSCYQTVAAAIHDGAVRPSDEIVLLGSPSLGVFHAVVAHGDRMVTDSLSGEGSSPYDSKTGIYVGIFNGREEKLTALAKITVADFKSRYMGAPKP